MRRSNSKHIHGKFGKRISFTFSSSYAFCLNITSWDRAISVISVVFFLPILPQVIDTMGRELIKPLFLISKWLRIPAAIVLLKFSNITQRNGKNIYRGTVVTATSRSRISLTN